MSSRHFRSFGLVAALAVAAGAALVHCAAPEEEDEALSEDQVTGVNNALGLGLRFDDKSGHVHATLKTPLKDGEKLFVRVRRGKIQQDSQKTLKCEELAQARPLAGGERELTGRIVYQGPKVEKSIFDLVHLYDDPNWATGDVAQSIKDDIKKFGPDPIVEACVMKGDKVRARLLTNLAYAWDQGTKAEKALAALSSTIRLQGTDAGLEGGAEDPDRRQNDAGVDNAEGGAGGNGRTLDETNVTSQIEYGQLCVEQLGEIPFFKKLGPGKYDTFDCRNLVGMHDGESTGPIDGVEGAMIPVTVDGVPQEKCSPGKELGLDSESYGCMDKADHGMFLATGKTQPGPMVVTARNDKGTHWLLLCRKVADDGKGMTKTTVFNDMAMIGTNPKTGRTCFFQNSIGSGRDGSKVPHPADVEKSTSVWSSYVQNYCSGSCHSESAFVHSPWIDGAKRSNGKPIVPKAGEHPDWLISDLGAPYNIVAADKLGFDIPKQLVSDEVGACNNCHRLAGNTMKNFADWTTGKGDDYFSNITDYGKKFEHAMWMPPRKDGLTPENFATSKYGKALDFMKKCAANANAEGCIWADVPRGDFNNPAVRP